MLIQDVSKKIENINQTGSRSFVKLMEKLMTFGTRGTLDFNK